MLKKILSLFLFLAFGSQFYGQITVTTTSNANTLAQALAGPGVTISNASISCGNNSTGTFSYVGAHLGLTNGVILTTGHAIDVAKPSGYFCNVLNNGGATYSDPDLTAIDNKAVYDVCILEFDVIPACNTLSITYVFGSEEYYQFVNSIFNDAFGVFLTGPNPGGGNYIGTNIAKLPNGTPVSINNVNNGPNGNAYGGPATNPAYFVDNYSSGNNDVAFDGYTVPVTSTTAVTPCTTYHVKIGIADASDEQYDSGVFLKQYSVTCASPPVIAAVPTNTSCGNNNGVATASVTNYTGTGSVSYSWSPGGATTATISGLAAGNYTCTVGFGAGCGTTTQTVVATVGASANTLSSSISAQANVACNGGNSGTATINPSGGAGGNSYNWSPAPGGGQGTTTATGLSNGVYNCTITDANSCTHVQAVTITQPAAALTSSVSAQTNVACKAGNSGAATINPSGGTAGYSYVWSPAPGGGQGTTTATGLSNGVYNCTITDANSCTHVQAVTITQPAAVLASSITAQTNVACNAGNSGAATINPSGGTAGYTYVWSPAPGGGQGTTTATGLSNGVYNCTITDANSCTHVQAVTITQPAAALASSITAQTNVACNGGNSGTATINPSGGTAGYMYVWSPAPGGGQGTTTATGLSNGVYNCTITDANSCTHVQAVTITQPAAALASSISAQTNVACKAGNSGAATINPSGGTAGYSYVWSPAPGGGQGTTTATGLSNGVYNCTITDANSCTHVQAVTITQPAAALASSITAQTNVACNGGNSGTATINPSGGTAGYTYVWSPAPGGGQGTTTATGLSNGVYNCTITDANSCTHVQAITITQPAAALASSITAQTNVACNGGNSGTATINPSGGTAGYTYVWSPAPGGGQGTTTATGLSNGVYNCTITDANACTHVQAATITQPAASLAINSSSSTQTGCGIATGTATVSVTGGTGADTYTWSPVPGGGQGTKTATGLSATTYTVTIHDANLCPQSTTFTILTAGGPSVTLSSSANTKCNASCDGTAAVNVTGGTGAYTYSWSGGAGIASSASALCPATYTCTVHDANNCATTQTVIITAPSVLTASSGSQTNASCNGTATGSATVSASGGTPGYSYTWSGGTIGSGQSTTTAGGLTNGTYTCTVHDANACASSQTFTITQPAVLVLTPSSTQTGCGVATGTASVSAAGGTAGYTYIWTPAPGGGQNTANATALAVGSYTVSVTDSKGCNISSTFNITSANAPLANLTSSANLTCNASCNGTATVSASGGTGAYTYSWTGGAGSAASANGLCAGTYSCTITDANNCSVVQTAVITQPTVLTVNPAQTNVLCNSAATGTAVATVSGGTASYTYVWSPSGGNAATATGLTAGVYTCTVNDANSCNTVQTYTLTQPLALSISPSQSNLTCNGNNSGAATALASGGSGSYTYAWVPSGGTAVTASSLAAGNYTCTVTDANSCSVSQVYAITQPKTLNTSANAVTATCNLANGSATASPSGGSGSYQYSWIPSGGNAATANGLAPGNYTCNVKDSLGCTASASVTIINTGTKPVASVNPSGSTSFCQGTSTVLAATGGTSYSWNTGATNDWITVTTAGTYTVHVINSCGTDSAKVQVTVNPLPVALVSGGTTFCKGDSSLLVASGGNSYSWSDGYTGSSHYVHNSGSYTVTATNTCGSTSTSVNVTVNSITAGYIQSADSGYYPLPVVFTDTSKVNPVSWSWTFGDGGTSNNQNPNNTYTASGIYTVTLTVTNAAGCTNTKTSVITISDTPSWITIPTVFTPNGDGTNDLLLISSAGIVEFHADFFDRWGVLLASINNVNEAWDGRTVGGQPLSSGTYYYLVTAKGDDKRVFNLKGFVELIH